MGQFFYTGITTNFSIKKSDYEKLNEEEFSEYVELFTNASYFKLDKEFSDEEYLTFSLDNDLVKVQDYIKFLKEQIKLYNFSEQKESKYSKTIQVISKANDFDEIIDIINQDDNDFMNLTTISYNIILPNGELLKLFMISHHWFGKAYFETFRDFFIYTRNCIIENSNYKEIAKLTNHCFY